MSRFMSAAESSSCHSATCALTAFVVVLICVIVDWHLTSAGNHAQPAYQTTHLLLKQNQVLCLWPLAQSMHQVKTFHSTAGISGRDSEQLLQGQLSES